MGLDHSDKAYIVVFTFKKPDGAKRNFELSYQDIRALSAFGLLLGLGTLAIALTSSGAPVYVSIPILIVIGSTIGLLISFRKRKTTASHQSHGRPTD